MSERGAITLAVPAEEAAAVLAMRGAMQPDHLDRARGIVLLDRTSRPVDAAAVVRDWVSEDDPASLAAPSDALLASRLRVGLARRLALDVRHLMAGGSAIITPLVLPPDGAQVVAVLDPKTATATVRESSIGGAWRCARLVWELVGVACVAVHVAGLDDGPAGNAVQVLGGVAAPQGAVSLGGPLLQRWSPVPETNPNTGQDVPAWALEEV
ncbi:hypothetical protein [Megalodesulfovibrio gigas]|uniref:Uncharacterized protein n=1 Tax=Megalodesulfovibrio gigas (strain ATCC 19364 / DSM 1382 / NCIMB 9332 / VKM B-1759) TaxID=1121448 RepID=T2G761_MEGG1|nr:hypothetical protein [Megalodesulfovibrio gigas]AGW12093.1 hypothetical protein DGI_0156 [Megalodesulfovibrio gigas DSM 1382 = ATCC 19364]